MWFCTDIRYVRSEWISELENRKTGRKLGDRTKGGIRLSALTCRSIFYYSDMHDDDQRAHLERIMQWWRLRGALPLNPERRLCERAPPSCTIVAATATCIAAATTSSDNLRRRQRRRRRRSLNYQQHSHARTHARTRLHGGRNVVVL